MRVVRHNSWWHAPPVQTSPKHVIAFLYFFCPVGTVFIVDSGEGFTLNSFVLVWFNFPYASWERTTAQGA